MLPSGLLEMFGHQSPRNKMSAAVRCQRARDQVLGAVQLKMLLQGPKTDLLTAIRARKQAPLTFVLMLYE